MTSPQPKFDTLLEPLLLEESDEHADELLLRLISTHAEPVIKGVIRYKLHLNSSQATQKAEFDDIYQEVLVQLLAQLQRFRKLPNDHPITDVRGMAAIIAHRTCSGWMRRQFPERHAFKNRLHYLLTRQRGFALWQNEDGKLVGGFEVWRGKKRTVSKLGDTSVYKSFYSEEAKPDLAATVAGIFNNAGNPVEFDDLVSGMATILGIRDQPIESLSEGEDGSTLLAESDEPGPAWQIEKRIFLQRLWEELQQLPLNQRAALLLNLKDSNGASCITLFPITGIASLDNLAKVLSIDLQRFAELWNELPLEDAKIAELLGLTRQQVINARKSGRERLGRRLKGFF
jgi:DNA-directed RNA polymerase specialized sigma24 family protein